MYWNEKKDLKYHIKLLFHLGLNLAILGSKSDILKDQTCWSDFIKRGKFSLIYSTGTCWTKGVYCEGQVETPLHSGNTTRQLWLSQIWYILYVYFETIHNRTNKLVTMMFRFLIFYNYPVWYNIYIYILVYN